MASYADIPDHLKDVDRKTDFLNWVHNLAADRYSKKELVTMWSRAFMLHLRAEDYRYAVGSEE